MIIKQKKLTEGYSLHLVLGRTGRKALIITYPDSLRVFAVKDNFAGIKTPAEFFLSINNISDIFGFEMIHGALELKNV